MKVADPPLDHVFPVGEEDVSTTLPPWQKVVGPPAVIVGAAGFGSTEIVTGAEVVDKQPFTSV
jgi:hypothetical protein